MLDWNLPHEGLRSLKFVAHITTPRNSVLILFGSRVGSLWVPFATEQPHQYVAWERMFLMRSCLEFVNLVVLPFFVYAPFPFRGSTRETWWRSYSSWWKHNMPLCHMWSDVLEMIGRMKGFIHSSSKKHHVQPPMLCSGPITPLKISSLFRSSIDSSCTLVSSKFK
jgi:hypothetical protein